MPNEIPIQYRKIPTIANEINPPITKAAISSKSMVCLMRRILRTRRINPAIGNATKPTAAPEPRIKCHKIERI